MKGNRLQCVLCMVAICLIVAGCGRGLNLQEIAPMTLVGAEGPDNRLRRIQGEVHKLSFSGKLEHAPASISAIGTNGARSYLYFGSKDPKKTVFALEAKTGTLTTLETKVHKKSHNKEGYYDAASEKNSLTNNPEDETVITSIVAGPHGTAIMSLTGLSHRHGGIYGTPAQGGILEIDKNVVSGVWGNVIGSLNSADSKEISSIAVLKDSWVAFSDDKNSIGAFRTMSEKIDQAKEGPSGVNGDAIGTVITAALGAGTDLYVAYEGNIKLRNTADVAQLCEIDFGKGAEHLIDIAKPSDLQTVKGGSDVIIITSLALLGRKLLVGMANYSQYGGGVAVVDLNDPSFLVTPAPRIQSGLTIKHIAPSQDGSHAIITTDGKGLLYFIDDKMVEISKGTFENLRLETVSSENPLIIDGAKEAREQGFKLEEAQVGAAEIDHVWYIATEHDGIYKFNFTREKSNS